MTTWQPIHLAPRDGTEVLTWGKLHDFASDDEEPCMRISRYLDEFQCWFSDAVGGHHPTLWMQLPNPPKGEDG